MGNCIGWSQNLLYLMVAANIVITVSYFLITFAIMVFLDQQKANIQLPWIFLLFASFIFMGGATHAVEVVTFWYPAYYVQGWTAVVAAVISLITAIMMWPLVVLASTKFSVQGRMLALQAENQALKDELDKLKKTGTA